MNNFDLSVMKKNRFSILVKKYRFVNDKMNIIHNLSTGGKCFDLLQNCVYIYILIINKS